MENYALLPNEIVIFEDNVHIKGSTTFDHLVLTNQRIIIICTEKKIFKKDTVTVMEFPVSDIKMYNGKPQVSQKVDTVTIYFTSSTIIATFSSFLKAAKFTTKATELITGEGFVKKGAGKVKSAIGLVDETLGINTMGTITGVLENGVGKTLFKGISTPISKLQKANSKVETISAVANGASAVIQATSKASATPETTGIEISYEQKIESVKKLKELVDMGILSDEEFETKKKEILGL